MCEGFKSGLLLRKKKTKNDSDLVMQANSTHTAGDGLLLSVIPLLQPKTFPLRCWETVSKRQRSERDGERERRGRETTHLDGNLTSLWDEVIDARIGVLFAVPSPPLSLSLNAGLQQVYRKCSTRRFLSSLSFPQKKVKTLQLWVFLCVMWSDHSWTTS